MQETRAPERTPPTRESVVELPAELERAELEVYLNGVRQYEERDFRRVGCRLVFDRPLAREGRLGFWRWASMFLGVAGTYRQNDTVDVIYRRDGRRLVLSGLPIEARD